MPIDLSRENAEEKLKGLSYDKGVSIKRDVADFLSGHTHAFRADQIVAEIDTAANAIQVEAVLGHHDVFSYGKKNGKLYWYVEDEDMEKAREIAEKRL